MSTSAPTISRLESGTHVPSLTTLSRIGEAVGEHLVIGYEPAKSEPARKRPTLVAV